MTTARRKKMGLSASDVHVGQNILFGDAPWSVAAPHPESGKFWLHRWVEGRYETAAAHVTDLRSLYITEGLS